MKPLFALWLVITPTLIYTSEVWWSRKPLESQALPPGDRWCRNEVDRFVLANLRAKGLEPSEIAPALALVRRVTYDLTGLPPTPEEVARFEEDYAANPDKAYEAMVDRLLASPHYGERFARHWLDVAKYADTCGYDKDKLRPNAWPYRDYVIRSFNEDKTYAQFVQEQIAGDVLFPGTEDGILGLGFLAAGPWDFIGHVEVPESKIDGKVARNLDRDDMLTNTMNTFCAVTIQCARCHEHKGDPIGQEHYYSLQAVFAAVDKADRPYGLDPEVAKKRVALESRIQELEMERKGIEKKVQDEGGEVLAEMETKIKKLQAAVRPQGKRPEFGYHSGIEKRDDREKWVQVDLGKLVEIKKIVLHACHDDYGGIGAGFGFPKRFKVAASNNADFSQSETLVDQSGEDFPNPGLSPLDYEVVSSARYIRVTATKLAPRTNDFIFAISELEVLDTGGQNQASGSNVTSLDSIEAPVRWRRSNLTDNVWPAAKDNSAASDLAILEKQKATILSKLETPERKARLDDTAKELENAKAELEKLPVGKMVYAAATDFKPRGNFKPTGGKPRPIHVLHRGEVLMPKDPALPGTIPLAGQKDWKFNLPESHTEADRRVALAKWITTPDNPLTWRAVSNRIWQWHFEKAIVPTPNDFGGLGQKPTHPELLDWLAMEFRDNGGSFKHLHKIILMSATYRQTSTPSKSRDTAQAKDAQNTLLWKMNRRKLSAEEIRDSILSISGKLDKTMGGEGYYLFALEKTAHSPHYEYHKFDPEDPNSHRRAIYRFIVRSQPNPFMTTLDCADSSQSTPVRNETLTALQALSMLNNKFTLSMARHFAKRLENESSRPCQQIQLAHQLLTGRNANKVELDALLAFATKHGLPNLCRALFSLSEFTYLD
jgi:hypothetical protein